ncbi:ATP-dependent nuclease [Hydrogenophaga intermedia]|uniref:ATP-dependent nuclease n=1 Tax=Hydrogenophaga intermedia TaxID=65786 RepID=UPI0020434C10|nr:TOPRIM nucleotidyl transferase/hydrolase domain-containing protein [Hydrogenophaga intermedia]MCM3565479.1 AAA family ATPase [Hydrogenophaga intermedia]
MPAIRKVVLRNFKRFERLDLPLNPGLNVLLGDNEAGKSSVLLAIDLALSASRSKIEALGVESLLNLDSVNRFLASRRLVVDLPRVLVEIFLTDCDEPLLCGRNNVDGQMCDGIKLECAVPREIEAEVTEHLRDPDAPFPFEYYAPRFATFAEDSQIAFRKHVRHLLLDSSRIDSEQATRAYTQQLFSVSADVKARNKLESSYRKAKDDFRNEHLKAINETLTEYQFAVRTSTKANLETDLVILEDKLPLDVRGKGRQCFVKTSFALRRGGEGTFPLHLLLLEEPENHLSHAHMRKLVERLAKAEDRQLVVATHSSLICSRLDLRKAMLLGASPEKRAALSNLSEATARFFMKAPDNHVLEFALSKRVILVEGDAEFILIQALYEKHSKGSTLAEDGVHVISVGGTSFKRYLELARLLGIRVAVVRDNDGHWQKNCVDNYADFEMENARVFADADDKRNTFEVCVYQDNQALCERLFGAARKSLSVQDYMIANKADAAFELLEQGAPELTAPKYIRDAIAWIRQ